MNVLSLFDGMSCGQIALQRAGINVDNYFASEIDKHAIKVTQANFPNTVQLGSVLSLNTSKLPQIDLLIGGSPCTDMSFAGKMRGMQTKTKEQVTTLKRYLELKEQGFEFEGQSYLFWEYVRILREIKPKYFMLENVMMLKHWKDIITRELGVFPVMINSALVSAQNRERLYWTNIPGDVKTFLGMRIAQPNDKKIYLRDILENGKADDRMTTDGKAFCVTARYDGACAKNSMQRRQRRQRSMVSVDDNSVYQLPRGDNEGGMVHGKSPCMSTSNWEYNVLVPQNKCVQVGVADISGNDNIKRVYSEDGKAPTLTAVCGGNQEPKVACGAYRGRYRENGVRQDHKMSVSGLATQELEIRDDGKTSTLTTVGKDNVLTLDKQFWRKLTPEECEALQTIPRGYTDHVAKTHRYHMLGNGWTVDVVAHIFKNLQKEFPIINNT